VKSGEFQTEAAKICSLVMTNIDDNTIQISRAVFTPDQMSALGYGLVTPHCRAI